MGKRGLDHKKELSSAASVRDTRTTGQRFEELVLDPANVMMFAVAMLAAAFVMTGLSDFLALVGIGVVSYGWHRQRLRGLPMAVPASSGFIDQNEINPGTKKPEKAKGIIYLGNDRETGEEIWITDVQARTHMMFLGTTGSGKTEFLLSVVFNALLHASGFIYVDGKADSELYAKLFSICRAMGRDDDILVINFQTGAKDIFGAQPVKMSNTMNPFSVGSSGMLSQLVISLMSSSKEGGKSDVWENRAISFVEAVMKPLVFLRERYNFPLDVNSIREFFELTKLEEFVWKLPERYPGLDAQLDGLKSYLSNLPGYQKARMGKHESVVYEQHGYITMQLVRTFNSLADVYGYIMRTPLAEVDFVDVFLRRRILVVLLPALEKAPPELTNLGRIIVASIKNTMATGLGARLEGDYETVIAAKPTKANSPFMCVLDEYGYYAVEGFAVVPAQARSIGFCAIFAGQDLPAFEKSSKEEAKSTLANTNTKFCGFLTCNDTFDYFAKLAGKGKYTRTGGFQLSQGIFNGYMDMNTATIEEMDRVTFDDLKSQKLGEWHMFYGDKILRINSFYANPPKVRTIRVNHFIRIARPTGAEANAYRTAVQEVGTALKDGFSGKVEATPVRDFLSVNDGFDKHTGLTALNRAIAALFYYIQEEQARFSNFEKMLSLAQARAADAGDEDEELDGEEGPEGAISSDGEPEFFTVPDRLIGVDAEGRSTTVSLDDESGDRALDAGAPDYLQGLDDEEIAEIQEDLAQRANVAPGGELTSEALAEQALDDYQQAMEDLEAEYANLGLDGQNLSVPRSYPRSPEEDDIDAEFVDGMSIFNYDDIPPGETGGLLNRTSTEARIASLEKALGATDSEANQAASATARAVAIGTAYPITRPRSGEADLSDFTSVAHRLMRSMDQQSVGANVRAAGAVTEEEVQ